MKVGLYKRVNNIEKELKSFERLQTELNNLHKENITDIKQSIECLITEIKALHEKHKVSQTQETIKRHTDSQDYLLNRINMLEKQKEKHKDSLDKLSVNNDMQKHDINGLKSLSTKLQVEIKAIRVILDSLTQQVEIQKLAMQNFNMLENKISELSSKIHFYMKETKPKKTFFQRLKALIS